MNKLKLLELESVVSNKKIELELAYFNNKK